MANEGEARALWNQLLEGVDFKGVNKELDKEDLWNQLLKGTDFAPFGIPPETDYVREIPGSEADDLLMVFLSKDNKRYKDQETTELPGKFGLQVGVMADGKTGVGISQIEGYTQIDVLEQNPDTKALSWRPLSEKRLGPFSSDAEGLPSEFENKLEDPHKDVNLHAGVVRVTKPETGEVHTFKIEVGFRGTKGILQTLRRVTEVNVIEPVNS